MKIDRLYVVVARVSGRHVRSFLILKSARKFVRNANHTKAFRVDTFTLIVRANMTAKAISNRVGDSWLDNV